MAVCAKTASSVISLLVQGHSLMWKAPYRDEFVVRPDGLRVSYRVFGDHDRTFVIANGHGAPQSVWAGIIDVLLPDAQVIIWDYLGQHQSDVPPKEMLVDVCEHCEDLALILAREETERYVMGGWSLGVQVALAQYERDRERIDGLALMHGVPGRIMHHVCGAKPEFAFPATHFLKFLLSKVGRGPQQLIHKIARRPELSVLYERLGLIHTTHAGFGDLVEAFTLLDLEIYLGVALQSDAHSTDHWLHTINVPTLVTLGLSDVITPSASAAPLFSVIPTATVEIFDGSHFPMFEAPGRLTVLLRQLLQQTGHP